MQTLFFFGSLRDRELLRIVLGRDVSPDDIQPAVVEGYVTKAFATEAYPYLQPQTGAVAEGVLVSGLNDADVLRLEYFEEAEYGLQPIEVRTDAGLVPTQYFRSTGKVEETDRSWSFADWTRYERAVALEAADELMAHFDIVPVEESDAIWPGIMIRARMRSRAKGDAPVTGALRQTRHPKDVESIEVNRPYTAYFALEEHVLRHRKFDGRMSEPIHRAALTSGDAVTILPYDARTDRVMLIEQFRAPMFARGDACPWGIETIAGRIDQETDAELCARREAEEEGGLQLGRVETIAAYYTSPGIAAEHVTSFVGEAHLVDEGGVYGLASENEDIRAFTVDLDEALAAITSGEINNAPAILSLQWLGMNRERLKALWRDDS